MYEERKDKFSFKSFFLTILLVLLFIFLMLWLFPTKWDVNKLQSTYDLERLSVLYDEIFANNVGRMKDAAIGYFTNERMPQVVGESKKLTLQEMYDLHLVLKMKDKDGKACHVTKSYVEMTKYSEEYRLKVNLSCGDVEDYIIVYLGCYNYCPGGICEKRVPTPSKVTKNEEQTINPENPERYSCQVVNGNYYDRNGNIVNKQAYELSCNGPTPITKKYSYEYKLVTEDCENCNNWSSWQKEAVTETDTVKVQTKTEKEFTGNKEVKIQTGTKTETVAVGTKTEEYVKKYITKLVYKGKKDVWAGTTTKKVTEEVQVGTVTTKIGVESGARVPNNTATRIYKQISVDEVESCSYCTNNLLYTWEIYEVTPVMDVVEKEVTVPVYKSVDVFEEEQVPVYGYKTVDVTEEVTKPVYEIIKVPTYKDVTYYRYRTCTFVKGITDIKWSESKFDSNLIGKGYKLTGNVKEI